MTGAWSSQSHYRRQKKMDAAARLAFPFLGNDPSPRDDATMVMVGLLTSLNLTRHFHTDLPGCLSPGDSRFCRVEINHDSLQNPQQDAKERACEPGRAGFRLQICFQLHGSVHISQPLCLLAAHVLSG